MRKAKKFVLFLFVLMQVPVFGQSRYWWFPERNDSTAPSKEKIQGSWTCFESVFDSPMLNHDEIGPYHLGGPETLIFEGDSMYEYNYPCELLASNKFDLLSDLLSVYHGKDQDTQLFLKLDGDTLSMFGGEAYDRYILKRYTRTQVDEKVISLLKNKKINPECKVGKWKLVTEYDSGYDGNGIVQLEFPFQAQSVLNFTPGELKMTADREIFLFVAGKKRAFYIESFSEYNDEMKLVSGKWWKKEPAHLTYRLVLEE